MTNTDNERQAFDSWWLASKYRQVIYANDSMRQIALDGWLARAKAGGGVDGWRTIESAPVDETRVLCWDRENGARESRYRFYGVGSIARDRYEKGTGPRGSWEWYEPQSNWGGSWSPTHWMPLTSPPKEDGE